jgi:hypothetical protein
MRNVIAAAMTSTTKSAKTTSCVVLNGCSVCVGVSARYLVVSAVVAVSFNVFVAVVQSFKMQFRSLLRNGLRQWFDYRDVLQ